MSSLIVFVCQSVCVCPSLCACLFVCIFLLYRCEWIVYWMNTSTTLQGYTSRILLGHVKCESIEALSVCTYTLCILHPCARWCKHIHESQERACITFHIITCDRQEAYNNCKWKRDSDWMAEYELGNSEWVTDMLLCTYMYVYMRVFLHMYL